MIFMAKQKTKYQYQDQFRTYLKGAAMKAFVSVCKKEQISNAAYLRRLVLKDLKDRGLI